MTIEQLLEALPASILISHIDYTLTIFKLADNRWHAAYYGKYFTRGKDLKKVLSKLYQDLKDNNLL